MAKNPPMSEQTRLKILTDIKVHGMTQTAAAEKYGVARTAINALVNGKTFR